MAHVQQGVLIIAGDELDRMDQLLLVGVIEQKREVLNGLVSEPPAAGLLPRQMLVKDLNPVTRARELLATHGSGRSAADDCDVCHLDISLTAPNSARGVRNPFAGWPCRQRAVSVDRKNDQSKSSDEYSTEESRG